MFGKGVNSDMFLTSRARPLVSIGNRKFPRAQTTQATAKGLRAEITDWDISTWSTHRVMSHLHRTITWTHLSGWQSGLQTHLSDERSDHPSDPTEWRTEAHPQRPSRRGIHLMDRNTSSETRTSKNLHLNQQSLDLPQQCKYKPH